MVKIAIAVTVLISVTFVSPAAAQRLPGNVVPSAYTLWFAPDLQNATFRGRETIQVDIKTATSTVTLNAAEIQFQTVTITSGARTQTARVTLDAKNEMATLTVPTELPRGSNASIQIVYAGVLNDKLRGF